MAQRKENLSLNQLITRSKTKDGINEKNVNDIFKSIESNLTRIQADFNAIGSLIPQAEIQSNLNKAKEALKEADTWLKTAGNSFIDSTDLAIGHLTSAISFLHVASNQLADQERFLQAGRINEEKRKDLLRQAREIKLEDLAQKMGAQKGASPAGAGPGPGPVVADTAAPGIRPATPPNREGGPGKDATVGAARPRNEDNIEVESEEIQKLKTDYYTFYNAHKAIIDGSGSLSGVRDVINESLNNKPDEQIQKIKTNLNFLKSRTPIEEELIKSRAKQEAELKRESRIKAEPIFYTGIRSFVETFIRENILKGKDIETVNEKNIPSELSSDDVAVLKTIHSIFKDHKDLSSVDEDKNSAATKLSEEITQDVSKEITDKWRAGLTKEEIQALPSDKQLYYVIIFICHNKDNLGKALEQLLDVLPANAVSKLANALNWPGYEPTLRPSQATANPEVRSQAAAGAGAGVEPRSNPKVEAQTRAESAASAGARAASPATNSGAAGVAADANLGTEGRKRSNIITAAVSPSETKGAEIASQPKKEDLGAYGIESAIVGFLQDFISDESNQKKLGGKHTTLKSIKDALDNYKDFQITAAALRKAIAGTEDKNIIQEKSKMMEITRNIALFKARYKGPLKGEDLEVEAIKSLQINHQFYYVIYQIINDPTPECLQKVARQLKEAGKFNVDALTVANDTIAKFQPLLAQSQTVSAAVGSRATASAAEAVGPTQQVRTPISARGTASAAGDGAGAGAGAGAGSAEVRATRGTVGVAGARRPGISGRDTTSILTGAGIPVTGIPVVDENKDAPASRNRSGSVIVKSPVDPLIRKPPTKPQREKQLDKAANKLAGSSGPGR